MNQTRYFKLTSLVGEPVVHELWCGEQAGAAKVLRVLEHEEEVHVADEDADELHDAPAGDDHVEGEQHPGKVHGLESKDKWRQTCLIGDCPCASP